MKIKGFVTLLILLTVIQKPLFAKEWLVDLGGFGDFSNIQAAINAAQNGDTVSVGPGIYTGIGNRDISFNGKAITVASIAGAASTIIDCQGTSSKPHRGFTFNTGESSNSVVSGFTIQNGYAPLSLTDGNMRSAGGGIYCYGSSPTIEKCIISNNWADLFGSGIGCFQGSSPLISECQIINNASNNRGGGIYGYFDSSPLIVNSLVAKNSTRLHGGGLYFEQESNATIIHSTIADNINQSKEFTGGVASVRSMLTISNSILWNNVGNGTINLDTQYNFDASEQNIVSTYNCVLGHTDDLGGIGNIAFDPLFASLETYMLQLDSPCIDAASDAGVYVDLNGNMRPFDIPGIDNNGELSDYDMGAYEIPEPTMLSLLILGTMSLMRKKRILGDSV